MATGRYGEAAITPTGEGSTTPVIEEVGSTVPGSQDGGCREGGRVAAGQETPEEDEGEAQRGRGGGRHLLPFVEPTAPPEIAPKAFWRTMRPRSNSSPCYFA